MAFGRTSADLYYADHADVATIHRFQPGDAAPGPALARSSAPNDFFRDLYLSADDQTLAYLSAAPNLAIVHTLTRAGAHRELSKLTGASSIWSARGWLAEGFVLIRRKVLHDNLTADIEVLVIDGNGTIKPAGVITHAYQGTARLHPARRALYVTRIENGVHNLYEFSFGTGAVKAHTRNALPGVTFSGFQDIGPDALIGAREERRQDIWLSQVSGTPRPGNPAGR